MNPHTDLSRIVLGLRDAGLTVAFAESCTGGRLSADLTTIPTSSEVVKGSVCCYALEAKRTLLGIKVDESNVVSMETALQMALAAQRLFMSDLGVGTTGYLDGDRIAYWALVGGCQTWVVADSGEINFPSVTHRDMNREFVVRAVFDALSRVVTKVG